MDKAEVIDIFKRYFLDGCAKILKSVLKEKRTSQLLPF